MALTLIKVQCLIKADRYGQAAVMVGEISHEIDEQG
jgi:hypothetical protein